MVTVVTAAARQQHRSAWDSLVDSQPVPSPFQRSWWIDGVAPDASWLLVLDDSGWWAEARYD